MMNKEEDEKQAEETKAFKMFEEGHTPVELVKEGVCTSKEAEQVYKRYKKLESVGKPSYSEEEMIDKLSTQVGLLGSRLARIELQLSESIHLSKTRKCGKCDELATYSVGVVCHNCGKLDAYDPEETRKKYLKNVGFEGYRPWEEEEEDDR